jgi:hypothetical protein
MSIHLVLTDTRHEGGDIIIKGYEISRIGQVDLCGAPISRRGVVSMVRGRNGLETGDFDIVQLSGNNRNNLIKYYCVAAGAVVLTYGRPQSSVLRSLSVHGYASASEIC